MTSQIEFSFFAEKVKIESWKIHIFFRLTRVKPCQNRPELFMHGQDEYPEHFQNYKKTLVPYA